MGFLIYNDNDNGNDNGNDHSGFCLLANNKKQTYYLKKISPARRAYYPARWAKGEINGK